MQDIVLQVNLGLLRLIIEYIKSFLDYKEMIPEDYDGDDPGDHIETYALGKNFFEGEESEYE